MAIAFCIERSPNDGTAVGIHSFVRETLYGRLAAKQYCKLIVLCIMERAEMTGQGENWGDRRDSISYKMDAFHNDLLKITSFDMISCTV